MKSNGIEVFVVIKEEDKGEKLEILAVHGYGVDEPPIELAETLADHLGIKAYHRNLLFHALNISVSLDRLTAVFRTAGVPEYDGAWEYTIEGGYQGFNGKSHVTDGKLHLEIDLNSVKLVPFELALTKDGAVPVSGGIMGIVLLFAGRDGGKQEALLSKNLLSKYKDAGNSLTMPVFRLKETFTGKALGREQLQGEKIVRTFRLSTLEIKLTAVLDVYNFGGHTWSCLPARLPLDKPVPGQRWLRRLFADRHDASEFYGARFHRTHCSLAQPQGLQERRSVDCFTCHIPH